MENPAFYYAASYPMTLLDTDSVEYDQGNMIAIRKRKMYFERGKLKRYFSYGNCFHQR